MVKLQEEYNLKVLLDENKNLKKEIALLA